jgi:hypothetical protein
MSIKSLLALLEESAATKIIPFPGCFKEFTPNTTTMKTIPTVPSIEHFQLQALDQQMVGSDQAQISFRVEIEHEHMTQRILVALLDESRRQGMAIAIYPATGEVCDLTNGGGVIGYLSSSPLEPHQGISCELTIYKFGQNCVCSSRIQGETFLYPAFMMEGSHRITAMAGHDSGNGIVWHDPELTMSKTAPLAVA